MVEAPNFLMIFAASQWVMAIIGTSIFISLIWRAPVAAPLEWPEITNKSGLRALTLVRVAAMSLRSRGSLSSMTTFMPYFFRSSSTPARTSNENGSFSNAKATFRSEGFLPFFIAISAASAIELARYCSDVDRTAKMYL